MNINQKKLKLVVEGIKATTLSKMSDKQVNILFNKLMEQVTQPQKITKTVTQTVLPPGSETTIGDVSVANKNGKTTVTPVTETDDIEVKEKFESKSQQRKFYAKCGDGKTKEQKKWCKMADEFAKKTNFAKLPEKKETKENYLDMVGKSFNNVMKDKVSKSTPSISLGESEIEKEILRIVERHITPKMSKKELISLFEGDTKTAPTKPKEKERVKPKHPFKPDPNKKGAPKAKKSEMDEDTKTAPVKPKIKPGVKPKHPFKPDPNKKGAPKAKKEELPSFLTYKSLGLNIK